MRLSVVETGQRWGYRLFLRLVSRRIGGEPPDVMKALTYRPELFGYPFTKLFQRLIQGPSRWSIGERELLVTFAAHLNRCPFCTGGHRAVAATALADDTVVDRVLEDYRSAPISEELRAMLALVEALTTAPETVGPRDVAAARDAGVDDERIRQGVYLSGLMNTMNRVSRPLDYEPVGDEDLPATTAALLGTGYRIPPPAPWHGVRSREGATSGRR